MLGSSLTLLLACLLATATCFIVYDFFRTDQPQIAQEKQFSDSYPKVDMFAELHVPVLLVYINDTVPVEAADVPKYFHARIVSYRYVLHDVNEPLETITTIWDYVPCSQVIANGIPKEKLVPSNSGYLSEAIETLEICANIKPGDNLSVQGQGTDKEYEILSFEVYPCILESDCVPFEDVNNAAFTFSRGMKSMNLSNFENPITYKMSGDDFIYLNTAT